MNALSIAVAAVAAAGCIVLSGCSSKAVAAECGKQRSASEPVTITVTPGPKVSSDVCVVLPLTKITWVNAKDNSAQFELKFRTANPGGQNQPLKVPSKLQNGSYSVTIDAMPLSSGEQRYDYDIVSAGMRGDPAIIIKAQ
ncbi:hypothetical protein MNR01_16985 [Lysobacter sp. S4-A87]|uniref:hypothetical protein n=1 Tax=Lysobacter sp. S4-A87 TaxID=2925843 RepID=UPI001F533796|nr:hypothetical protein [Lysobacter sp. S4-A87]UNK49392.1 hypothetical protein MNR01_16985 [Lysobacter sp. S4-A87]